MAIASFWTPDIVVANNWRLSAADPALVNELNPAAYRRMTQVYAGDQDGVLISLLFPRATIELILMLEESWWPNFVSRVPKTTLWQTSGSVDTPWTQVKGQLVTGFNPNLIIKTHQTLMELEACKVIDRFYQALVNDNANINEKDKFNYEIAARRTEVKWSDLNEQMTFYDVNNDGLISKLEENNDFDIDYYLEDRRYF
jgi:hypothetical protein